MLKLTIERVNVGQGNDGYRIFRHGLDGGDWTSEDDTFVSVRVIGGDLDGQVFTKKESFYPQLGTYLLSEGPVAFEFFTHNGDCPFGAARVTVAARVSGYTLDLPEQCNDTGRPLVSRTAIRNGNGDIVTNEVELIGAGGCSPGSTVVTQNADWTVDRTWNEIDGSAIIPGQGPDAVFASAVAQGPGGVPSGYEGSVEQYVDQGGFDLEKWKSGEYAKEGSDFYNPLSRLDPNVLTDEVEILKAVEANEEQRQQEDQKQLQSIERAVKEQTVSTSTRLDKAVTAISNSGGGTGGPPTDMSGVEQKLDAANAALGEIATNTAGSGTGTDMSGVEGKLDTLIAQGEGQGDGTDMSGVEEKLDELIAQGEAEALKHTEAASGDADLPMEESFLQGKMDSVRGQVTGALDAYAPAAAAMSVPTGTGGAWMIDTGLYGSFDLNPMNHPDIASAAGLIKTLLAWFIFCGYALWVFSVLGQMTGEVLVTPQARGHAVFGGTGAQVTGLLAATMIVAVALLVPALWATHSATDYGSFSVFSIPNPVSSGSGVQMTQAVSMGWYLAGQFLPLELMFWVTATMVTSTFWLQAAVRGCQAMVKIIVP